MSQKANIVESMKGNSTLVRPRFSPGLLLRDDDLRVGVDYTRDLSRMLFRSLFGCGVVCGLVVDQKVSCGKLIITVASGVALNCDGDPIHVPQTVTIPIDPSCSDVQIPSKIWITLRLTEKACAPRSAACSCEDDDVTTVCTREQAGFEIRIHGVDPADCACGCAEQPLQPVASEVAYAVPAPAAAENGNSSKKKSTATNTTTANVVADAANGGSSSGRGEQSWSVDPCCPCYADHYAGKCDCCGCDNSAVVLAVLSRIDGGDPKDIGQWAVNHSVRRFVRPMLIRDPQVWLEQHQGADPCTPVS